MYLYTMAVTTISLNEIFIIQGILWGGKLSRVIKVRIGKFLWEYRIKTKLIV